ncbi:MAG: nucleotidyl transferase AbiEii/AbiGii toxin family protein [Candidatus Microgenomates bacterium]
MKIIMSKIHLELLDEKRKQVFYQLKNFFSIGYLAGGTALALQINHRISEDFDIFINKSIDNNLRLKIKKVFPKAKFTFISEDQINLVTEDNIKITFLWYYFPTINKLIKTDSISLASVDDIIADKAMTIGRRAVWRDYIDIFYLIKEKQISLKKIILLAKKKFKREFVETQFLEQLVYFDDLQIAPINFINKSYSEKEIKSFLKKKVKTYITKTI